MKLITEIFPYQAQAVDKLMHVKVGALYMEMGTGKTRTALELIERRLVAGKINQVLWLCPYSVQRDLPELLSEHAEDLDGLIRIAGIESLSSSMRLLRELMRYVTQAPTYLVIDESLLVKNPFAYRTRHVLDLAKRCAYRLILNGTPISRNEADLFSQWYVLDWRILGYRSYYSFAANHLEMDPERPGRVVRVLRTDYLSRKISPYTYQCSKDDVLKLPRKRYGIRYFYLTDEQESHYTEIASTLLAQVDEQRPDTIYRLFGAMQAIASGARVTLSPDGLHSTLSPFFVDRSDNQRLRALMQVLDDIEDEQAVIFCRYTQEINDILALLGDRAAPFYGEMTQAARQHSKTKFKQGEVQFLVANKGCAQFGLNLQFCHNGIFYNNDWDWGTRTQAEDRLHRVGQTREVHLTSICANGTLDETILRCLERKERMSDLFKNAVASHNKETVKQRLRAAVLGLKEGENDGKTIQSEPKRL